MTTSLHRRASDFYSVVEPPPSGIPDCWIFYVDTNLLSAYLAVDGVMGDDPVASISVPIADVINVAFPRGPVGWIPTDGAAYVAANSVLLPGGIWDVSGATYHTLPALIGSSTIYTRPVWWNPDDDFVYFADYPNPVFASGSSETCVLKQCRADGSSDLATIRTFSIDQSAAPSGAFWMHDRDQLWVLEADTTTYFRAGIDGSLSSGISVASGLWYLSHGLDTSGRGVLNDSTGKVFRWEDGSETQIATVGSGGTNPRWTVSRDGSILLRTVTLPTTPAALWFDYPTIGDVGEIEFSNAPTGVGQYLGALAV